MKKKISLLAIIFALCITFVQAASSEQCYAAGSSYVQSAVVSISGTRSNATCKTYVKGVQGTTKISVSMTLQKKTNGSWKNVQTWSDTKNASTLTLSKKKSLSKGTYRVKSVIKVYKKSQGEPLTVYSATKSF